MINDIESARNFANHKHLTKFDFVFVLPCGQIYCFDLIERAQKFLNENSNCFIVKGRIEKTAKIKIKEYKNIEE